MFNILEIKIQNTNIQKIALCLRKYRKSTISIVQVILNLKVGVLILEKKLHYSYRKN